MKRYSIRHLKVSNGIEVVATYGNGHMYPLANVFVSYGAPDLKQKINDYLLKMVDELNEENDEVQPNS